MNNIKILKFAGAVIGIGVVILGILYFSYLKFNFPIPKIKEIQEIQPLKYSQKEIAAPPPLTFPVLKETERPLFEEEIIKFTNYYRKENEIGELKRNQLLMEAAKIKVDEMFEKQYFGHISPEGKDAGDILSKVEYSYLIVGENLASGYFKDSKDLVDGWMGSAGHRRNILNPKFKEIGVAKRKDNFEGKEQYIAVQIFAAPQSLCPLPDRTLLLEIEEKKEELDRLVLEAENLKGEIEREIEEGFESKEEIEATQEKINEYNKLVVKINNLSREIENLVLRYNSQVEVFNQCVDTF